MLCEKNITNYSDENCKELRKIRFWLPIQQVSSDEKGSTLQENDFLKKDHKITSFEKSQKIFNQPLNILVEIIS